MSAAIEPAGNWSLKDEIRTYWSKRAATFDDSFGHRILPGPERDAWMAVLRRHLGPEPLHVLELASGTGEVTRVLRALGHRVTGLDFSEAMIARARAKHRGDGDARFVLADAENTMEPDGAYDAVVCRHLVGPSRIRRLPSTTGSAPCGLAAASWCSTAISSRRRGRAAWRNTPSPGSRPVARRPITTRR
jgi:SAM-dependent methyltransferase